MNSVRYMKRKGPPANLKATDEQLIAAAKIHGTSLTGIREIAKEFGYAGPQAVFQRVRRLMKDEGNSYCSTHNENGE